LSDLYKQTASVWRPEAEMRQMMWIFWVGYLVFAPFFALREGLRERQAWPGAGVSLRPVCGSHVVRDDRLWLVRDSADPARARVLLVPGDSGGIHRGGRGGGFGLPRLVFGVRHH